MIIDNKIEKTVSGPATILGISSFIFGIASFWGGFILVGILGSLIALFLLLSYTGIQINTKKQMVRPYNCWFGFFKTGNWKTLETYDGLTLVPMKKVYSVYSRSNQKITSSKNEYRVYLVDKRHKPALAIKRCKDRDTAQNSMDEFAIWLHLPVFSVKH